MTVGKTLDNLKDKPHEEKKVVASGIAIGVVIILLVGWGFLFLRKIQKGTLPILEGSAVPSDQFDAEFLKQTQEQLKNMYSTSGDDLRSIRDSSIETGAGVESVGTTENNVEGFGTE